MRAAVLAQQPVLNTEAAFVPQTRRAGAEATLFVESAAGMPVLRFKGTFLERFI